MTSSSQKGGSAANAPENVVADSWGVEVWRGGVNTWECDEMGHMNVRFYVAKALEGLAGFAAALGLPGAYSPHANATLIARDYHIRFLREAYAGAPLFMRGGVLRMGERDARLLLVIFHAADAAPAASVQITVDHVTPRNGQPFNWSARTLARAQALTIATPNYALPRGLDIASAPEPASVARSEALGLTTVGAGVILVHDCDVFGRMRAEQFIGRVSDGVGVLSQVIARHTAEALAPPAARLGSVALEYRLTHLRWPRAGDRVLLRSGLAATDKNTHRLAHWMLDPESGEAWGVARAVTATFDLDTRKLAPVAPAAAKALAGITLAGLIV